jgi:hypothetical protein
MHLKSFWNGLSFYLMAVVALVLGPVDSRAQPQLPTDANQFVREMIAHELEAQSQDKSHWRYHLHKEEDGVSQDRDVIETKEGSLARTLLINGRPLTPEQRSKDDLRMKKLVEDPEERAKRDRRGHQDEEKAKQLLKAFPDAFIFKYDGQEGDLVRLAFTPNPKYSPPTREMSVYHAMVGKLWIDRKAMRLAKIDGRLFEDVKFGWGLLGHLDKDGTFKVVQNCVGEDHWDTVFLDLNLQGRALIFKTLNVKQRQELTDYRRVPDDLTMDRAFQMLQKSERAVATLPKLP